MQTPTPSTTAQQRAVQHSETIWSSQLLILTSGNSTSILFVLLQIFLHNILSCHQPGRYTHKQLLVARQWCLRILNMAALPGLWGDEKNIWTMATFGRSENRNCSTAAFLGGNIFSCSFIEGGNRPIRSENQQQGEISGEQKQRKVFRENVVY